MKRNMLVSLIVLFLVLAGCSRNPSATSYTGIVEGTTVEVPALTGGKILELYFDAGSRVSAGDTLAVTDTLELSFEKQQVAAGLEQLSIQERIAATNLSRSRADMNYLQEKYERIRKLYENQSVPRQTLDDIANQLQRAQSAVIAAQENVSLISAQKNRLVAQLKELRKKMKDATITAPISGIVAAKYFEVGEAVPPLSPIAQIIDLSEVWVKIYISEKLLPVIRYGQEAQIRVDGLEEILRGSVEWISPKAEFTPKTILTPETRTTLVYAVKVVIPNPRQVLKHGMPVEVAL